MDRESVRTVVRATFILLAQISKKTRTPADDLMTSILRANEDRLVEAVMNLLDSPRQPPTEEQVVEALKSVGIEV